MSDNGTGLSRIRDLERQETEIIKRMSDLYLRYSKPYYIVDHSTGKMAGGPHYDWGCGEAYRLYQLLGERLTRIKQQIQAYRAGTEDE